MLCWKKKQPKFGALYQDIFIDEFLFIIIIEELRFANKFSQLVNKCVKLDLNAL